MSFGQFMVTNDFGFKFNNFHVQKDFLEGCLEYLDEWLKHMQFVKEFDWITLDEPVEWNKLDKTARSLMEKEIFPAEMHRQLCSNFGVLKATVNAVLITEYKDKKLTISERWVDFFKRCEKEGYDYAPLALIVSYILTIPGKLIFYTKIDWEFHKRN